jgi:hypothetical protein
MREQWFTTDRRYIHSIRFVGVFSNTCAEPGNGVYTHGKKRYRFRIHPTNMAGVRNGALDADAHTRWDLQRIAIP